jgi:adenosylcobyric acid synthase
MPVLPLDGSTCAAAPACEPEPGDPMSNRRAKSLMILGTASHSGKSITVAALCRIFRQDGLRVAPFKAQNMSLNSFATRDGCEIGRAQAVQARAAGLEPHVDMNPLLLKPSSEIGSQVVLNGKVFGNVTAAHFRDFKGLFFDSVVSAYRRLSARFDYIILEGAGSPVEMNLKDGDIVNMRMAEAAGAACILVGDIDRGGVFASLVGTFDLLTAAERERFIGFIINKFRGDERLLAPGVEFLESRLGRRCVGVVPFIPDLRIDEEDGVALDQPARCLDENDAGHRLQVCVIKLPHIANFTDFGPLQAESGISLTYATLPAESAGADVLVLPGSKNTIGDLGWLKSTGWDNTVKLHARQRRPVLGICGGFQMLGLEVRDPFHVESESPQSSGLALIDCVTTLGPQKVTRQASARIARQAARGSDSGAVGSGPRFLGYEIHMGETRLGPHCRPFLSLVRAGDDVVVDDGAITADGRIIGTYLHGLFDSDEGRIWLLDYLRRLCNKEVATAPEHLETRMEDQYEILARHFRRHIRLDAIYEALGISR